MAAVDLDPVRRWECPSCGRQHVSRSAGPHTPLHACPDQLGISVPFVQVFNGRGVTGVRHVVVEREDYVGDEVGVRVDAAGRVIMGVRTERVDGSNDALAFAPTALIREE